MIRKPRSYEKKKRKHGMRKRIDCMEGRGEGGEKCIGNLGRMGEKKGRETGKELGMCCDR